MPSNSLSWVVVSVLGGAVFLAAPSHSQMMLAEARSLQPQTIRPDSVVAQVPGTQLSTDFKAVLSGKAIAGTVTSKTPSPIRLSIPSLWWVTDQLAHLQQFGAKFIQEWIAYPRQTGQPGRVDLLVNRQQWSLLDYLERYQFVNQFSSIARSFGYNTRVYDHPDRPPIAVYACDFSPVTAQTLKTPSVPTVSNMTNTTTKVRSNLENQLTCRLNMNGSVNLIGR